MRKQSAKSSLPTLGLVIWTLLVLFFLYEFFLRTFIGSVAHQMMPDLNLNAKTFAAIGSSYYLAYGLMQLPVGILVDKFGVRIITTFATLVCALASIMFAHATGFTSAFISRFLMGFGSSFAFVCLLVVVTTWFPNRYFGLFAGVSQFIGTMGPLLAGGPLISMMTSYHQTWRTALSQIGMLGIILALLIVMIVKNKGRDHAQALIHLKRAEPIKSRLTKLIKNKQAWYIALYSGTVYVSLALLGAIWGTEYLQAQGLSQSNAASMVSLAWLGYAISCPALGAISDITLRRKPILTFCAALGLVSTAAIIYLPLQHAHWVYGVLFFNLGIAASGQNVGFAAIYEHVDISARTASLGLNNGTITLFGALVPLLASYCIYIAAGANNTELRPEHFILGFSIMPLLYSVSFLVSFFCIKETYCKPQKEAIILQT